MKTEAPQAGIRLDNLAAASRNSALFPSSAMLDQLQRQTRLLGELSNPYLSATASLRAAMDQNDVFRSLIQPPESFAFARSLTHHVPSISLPDPPNPERFYYDEWPRSEPVQHGSLTCDLFRHQNEKELFEVKVLFLGDGEVNGQVVCTVHADNLSMPAQLKVQVSRTTVDYWPVEIAEALIERF